MDIRILKTLEDFARYDAWVKEHPQGNLWQSLEWKSYQEALGREIRVYVAETPHPALSRGERELVCPSPCPLPHLRQGSGGQARGEGILASALVVIDRTTCGWSTWDVPRGPLKNIVHALLDTIIRDARGEHCLILYLSPPSLDIAKSDGSVILTTGRLEASNRHEQPTATRIIDLTKSEEEILAQMHSKGRYNIKVAQKNGIHVEESRNIDAFYGLLEQTAGRDGFQILPLRAYKAFLERLRGSFLLMAFEASQKPVAGLIGVIWPGSAEATPGQGIYYYGASDYASRNLMAPYALQWEAMRLCKARGCRTYDLLGVTPPLVTLRNYFPHHDTSHPWAGVSTFKEKFGGTIVMYPPEQQIVLRPLLWNMLQWKRRIVG